MKKLLAFLLTLVLSISASVTVFAAEPALTISSVEAERGDIVYLEVALSGCDKANTISVEYEYDTDALKRVAGKSTWTKEADIADFNPIRNEGEWYVEDAIDLNGEICKIALQVKGDAPVEATKVKCTVVVKNEDKVLKTLTAEATVTVTCTHEAEDGVPGIKVDAENHKYKCVHCGTEIKEAHFWNNGKVTKVATEKETGIRTYTCTYCGETREEEIPKLESSSKPETEAPETEAPETEVPEKPEADKPSGNKPSGGNKPSTDDSGTTKPETDPTAPVEIPETVVKEKVAEIEKAAEGESVVINMQQENGKLATVIPVEILEAVKGKDVNVVFDMGDYSWTINGKDVAETGLKDINLKVELDAKVIEEAAVKAIAGDDAAVQISLEHDGEFNFKATLKFNVGKEFAGKFGNLYYHKGNGEFTFVLASKVDANGDVMLEFEHASDYVLVLGEERSADDVEDDEPLGSEEPSTEDTGDKPTDNKGDNNAVVIVIVVLLVLALVAGVIVFLKKKKMI